MVHLVFAQVQLEELSLGSFFELVVEPYNFDRLQDPKDLGLVKAKLDRILRMDQVMVVLVVSILLPQSNLCFKLGRFKLQFVEVKKLKINVCRHTKVLQEILVLNSGKWVIGKVPFYHFLKFRIEGKLIMLKLGVIYGYLFSVLLQPVTVYAKPFDFNGFLNIDDFLLLHGILHAKFF